MTLTGTGKLVRFIVRRNRFRLAVWITAVVAIMVVSGASLLGLYPDEASIVGYTTLFSGNPALVVFAGPGYGFDTPSLGVILVNETQLWGAISLALMSIFLVTRSSRTEEDAERIDLVRSLPVGRHASTTAALVVVGAANLTAGAASAAGFIMMGYPTSGSVALAASMVAAGLMFAAITAVAAQLTSSARGCLGLSSLVLAAAFVVRAAGDVAESQLSLLSPLGLAQGVRAFADERWWTLAVAGGITVALGAVSFMLADRRNLGSGLLGVRPGPAGSPALIHRPLGVVPRLQRNAFIGWLVGLFTLGLVYGSIAESIDQMVADTPALADVFAQSGATSLTDAYLATAMTLMAIMAGGLAISSTLAASTEERTGRAENLLAGPLARWRWFGTHLGVATVQSTLAVVVAGVAIGVAYAVTISDPGQITRMAAVALVYVPPVLVLAGVAAAIYGFAPRFALSAWGALAAVAVIGLLGELLRLPGRVQGISPFHHLPSAPGGDLSLTGPAVLAVIAALLMAAATLGLRRRDMAAT